MAGLFKRVVPVAAVLALAGTALGQASRPAGGGGGREGTREGGRETRREARQAGGQQGAGGALQKMLEQYRDLIVSLDLNDNEMRDVREVMQDSMGKMRELQGAPADERREKVQALVKEMNEAIADKLPAEKRAKFADGLREIMANARNGEAGAASRPTTAPTTRAAGGAAGAGGGGLRANNPLVRQFQVYREAVMSLDLTAEQKTKVEGLFGDARRKLEAVDPGAGEVREQVMPIMQELRAGLSKVLTPEQQQALQEKVKTLQKQPPPPAAAPAPERRPDRPRRGGQPPAEGKPEPRMPGQPGEALPPMDSPPPPPPRSDGGGKDGGGKGGGVAAASDGTGVEVGTAVPELVAKKLDGTVVKLAAFRNRPVVLIFGSMTAPTFRDKAAQLNTLYRDYRGKAEFLVVYTAEAHPIGEWEVQRNKDDKIRVEAHKSEADRVAAAKGAQTSLRLEPTVVVDTMADVWAKAFGVLPNGAVIVGRDGTVRSKQKWFEAFALRRALDEAGKPTTTPVAP